MPRRERTIGSHYRITGCDDGFQHLLGAKAYAYSLTRVRIVSGTYSGLEVPISNLKMRKIRSQALCTCGLYKFPHKPSQSCEPQDG